MMIRRLFWLLTVFSLTGVVITSLALFAGPSAEVAQWAGWSFLGLSRPRWESLHYGCGVLLFLSGLICMITSGRRIMASGEDESDPAPIWIVAIIVFTVVVLSSVLMLPPGGTLEYMSAKLKTWHAKSFGEPPLAGAADLSPTELAKRLSMDPGKALINLATHNVKLSSPDATIGEIARQNGLAPAAVYETLRGGRTPVIPAQAQVETRDSRLPPPPPQLPADPPPGLGRLKLVDVCEQYGLNLDKAVETLAKANIRASGDMTLRQIAQSNLMLPVEVYDALRGTPQKPYSPSSAPAQSAQAPAQAPAPPQTPAPAQQAQPAPAAAPAQQTSTPAQAPEQPAPTPQAAQPQQPAPGAQQPGPEQPQAPEGLERMTLAAYCRDHGLDTSQSLAKLKSKGIVAFSDMTFRELAIENNLTPAQVLDLMVK